MHMDEPKLRGLESQGLLIARSMVKRTRSDESGGRRQEERLRALASRDERAKTKSDFEDATDDIIHQGEGHLITIAPTGSGKGRSVIIPNLLNYQGSCIVIDPKGENYAVTSRYRKSIGQEIIRIDPFDLCSKFDLGDLDEENHFNPFDIMQYTTSDVADDIRTVMEMATHSTFVGDPFWPLMGRSLMSSAAQYIVESGGNVSLSSVKAFLDRPDLHSELMDLASDSSLSNELRGEFNGLINVARAETTFAGIVAVAKSNLTIYSDRNVSKACSDTTFDLDVIYKSLPFTLYLVFPVDKLNSHQSILRVWLGALIRVMTSRKKMPKIRTLMLIDEAAQLGELPIIEETITLARGYGVQMWSFWQDFSQVRRCFPNSWETILNNCSIVQFFGAKNTLARDQISTITGISSESLSKVGANEQVVLVDGFRVCRARKFDYLEDDLLSERSQENPYYRRDEL